MPCIDHVDIRASVEEQLRDFDMPAHGRQHQRRAAIEIDGVHGGFAVEERLDRVLTRARLSLEDGIVQHRGTYQIDDELELLVGGV